MEHLSRRNAPGNGAFLPPEEQLSARQGTVHGALRHAYPERPPLEGSQACAEIEGALGSRDGIGSGYLAADAAFVADDADAQAIAEVAHKVLAFLDECHLHGEPLSGGWEALLADVRALLLPEDVVLDQSDPGGL